MPDEPVGDYGRPRFQALSHHDTPEVFRRDLGLILLGFVLYHLDGRVKTWDELTATGVAGFAATAFQRSVFQTLVHIALASIRVLPVIAAGPLARAAFLP